MKDQLFLQAIFSVLFRDWFFQQAYLQLFLVQIWTVSSDEYYAFRPQISSLLPALIPVIVDSEVMTKMNIYPLNNKVWLKETDKHIETRIVFVNWFCVYCEADCPRAVGKRKTKTEKPKISAKNHKTTKRQNEKQKTKNEKRKTKNKKRQTKNE